MAHETEQALRPVEFHILVALSQQDLHGYGIMREVARLTEGEIELEPGTLYRALRRLVKSGHVVESGRRPARELDDERRRYYRLTPLGRRAAAVEAVRLRKLLVAARAGGLL